MTTLISLRDPDLTRGYYAGRHYFFVEAETDEQRIMTDTQVLDRLRELADEYDTYEEAQKVLRFSVGGLLGLFSGPLFPWTWEEQARLEQESVRFWATWNPCLSIAWRVV